MMENRSAKAWLYLLPALVFIGVFMVYPLVDVFVYSFEEGYNSASQTFSVWVCITIPIFCGIRIFCRL